MLQIPIKQQTDENITDPILPNPFGECRYYNVEIERVINAILLGIITIDANLMIITPLSNRI